MKFHGMFGGGRWFLAAGLAMGAMAGVCRAQSTAADGERTKQPVLNPPGSDKKGLADKPGMDNGGGAQVEIWTEARYVLEKELDVVKSLKSVKGSNLSVWEHNIEGLQPMRQEFPMSYAVEKPNKLQMDTKDMSVFCDGQTVTVYSKQLKQYVQRPMTDIWGLRETVEQISQGQVRNIPCEPMLRPGMTLEQTLKNVVSVERSRAGEREGKMGTWVSGTAVDDRQPGSNPYSFERWYSDDDHLVHAVTQNWTAMYQDMADRRAAEEGEGEATPRKAQRYQKVGWTITQSRELNPKLPAETFLFKPSEGDRKVEQFVFVIHPGVRDQIGMIGKPAPALVGKDFDGKEVDIAGMKGKVVVLDFWATWCGPCCASLPSMQMIKTKYADKPFALIGMNRERAGDERKVKPYLAHRDLDIQQFNDVDGKAAEAFVTTNSIPCVVIIDQEGNIADIENGYLPGKEKELMAKIEKLFAGKPVHTTAELEAIREQIGPAKAN